MDKHVLILDQLPTPAEYRALCTAVGWAGSMNLAASEAALAGSRFGVVAVKDNQVIGMGRVVGDGAMFFYVQDVAVHPGAQGQGIGRLIIERLLALVRASASGPALVGLFATEVARPLYIKLGFADHEELLGMFQIVEPGKESEMT
jgi:GNAT superfamily N-acetyltransferase